MKKRLNKEGFTLIELLAVIVVLAIVMIIAVPNVLTSMDTAKKKAFVTYAQGLITTASEKFEEGKLLGTQPNTSCWYDIANLKNGTTGDYDGFITVTVDATTGVATYKLTLTDKSYNVNNKTSSEITDTTLTNNSATITNPTTTVCK